MISSFRYVKNHNWRWWYKEDIILVLVSTWRLLKSSDFGDFQTKVDAEWWCWMLWYFCWYFWHFCLRSLFHCWRDFQCWLICSVMFCSVVFYKLWFFCSCGNFSAWFSFARVGIGVCFCGCGGSCAVFLFFWWWSIWWCWYLSCGCGILVLAGVGSRGHECAVTQQYLRHPGLFNPITI